MSAANTPRAPIPVRYPVRVTINGGTFTMMMRTRMITAPGRISPDTLAVVTRLLQNGKV